MSAPPLARFSMRKAVAAKIIQRLFTKGFTYAKLADQLLCDERTIRGWVSLKSAPRDEYWECLKTLEEEHLK